MSKKLKFLVRNDVEVHRVDNGQQWCTAVSEAGALVISWALNAYYAKDDPSTEGPRAESQTQPAASPFRGCVGAYRCVRSVELSQFSGELAVANLVNKLPSKIVQIANSSGAYDAWALCEDGSVWCFDLNLRNWTEMHPPHEPPTQAADLAEALDALRNLVEWASVTPGSAEIESREAFQAAEALLKKHGVD